MDIRGFKERCFNEAAKTEGADNAALAKLIGVSERQLRRYYDVNDVTMPTVVQMGIICETFNVSMDAFMFPERNLPPQYDPKTVEMYETVGDRLAVCRAGPDQIIRQTSEAYARLYGLPPEKLVGRHISTGWGNFVQEDYPWLPANVGDHTTSIVETLMAVAKEHGASSKVNWFISPNKNLKRILSRCWYLDPDFLFLDVPIDDDSLSETVDKVDVKDGQLAVYVAGGLHTERDYEVMHKFMSGWDIGHIAQHVSMERIEVAALLEQLAKHFGVTDLDDMREAMWEFATEDKFWHPYAVSLSDGSTLK